MSFNAFHKWSFLENIIKNIRNIFRLKKELNYAAIKDIKNTFRLKKEKNVINDRVIIDIWYLFGYHEENY